MRRKKLSKVFSTLALTMALVLNFGLVQDSLAADVPLCINCDASYNCTVVKTGLAATATCGLGAAEVGSMCVVSLAAPTTCIAGTLGSSLGGIGASSGLSTTASVPKMVGNTIRVILGLSGTAALIFVVVGGIKWMTSAGDAAKITKARQLMVSGAIGVLIIAAAYAITDFVMKQMISVVA